MPNRNMQAKFMKAKLQAGSYARDIADRATYRDTTGVATVTLADIVAAYKGPITKVKAGVRAIAAERHVRYTVVIR